MKVLLKIIFLLTYLTLVSCISTKIHIDEVGNKNSFHVSENKTFAWLWEPESYKDDQYNEYQLVDKVLREQLSDQLINKGYTLVSKKNADFLVSYAYLKQSLGSIESGGEAVTTDPIKAWVDFRNRTGRTYHIHESFGAYEEGSLVLFLKNQANEVIWTGGVSKLIDDQFADEVSVNKTISASLKKLLVYLPDFN